MLRMLAATSLLSPLVHFVECVVDFFLGQLAVVKESASEIFYDGGYTETTGKCDRLPRLDTGQRASTNNRKTVCSKHRNDSHKYVKHVFFNLPSLGQSEETI